MRGADGEWTAYRWVLTRQTRGPWVGAWMTDAVLPVSVALFDALATR